MNDFDIEDLIKNNNFPCKIIIEISNKKDFVFIHNLLIDMRVKHNLANNYYEMVNVR
jgi:hypothetical protein